jgi:XTP/dITP diphosphohydrolase
MNLVFASNNAHKLAEVREIMPAGVRVLSLKEIGFEAEIEETGTTLEENSMIKARAVANFIKEKGLESESKSAKLVTTEIDGVFADDTGLEIDALDGKPGVYTARWYSQDDENERTKAKSESEIFAANRAKALRELYGKSERGAQFRTVITVIMVNGDRSVAGVEDVWQVEGVVRGQIARKEYGVGGFGYDPIFIPEGYDKTFGELPAEIKNSISHRARALEALVKKIK